MCSGEVHLGLGLVGIGRAWGARDSDVPGESQVRGLLEFAAEAGITTFDTAPAYGTSEERLGRFLDALDARRRTSLFVATKCGETYDLVRSASMVDHSPDALRASIDRSLGRLGQVSLLQLHKATARVLADESVLRILEEYRGRGVEHLGASVSDLDAGFAAMDLAALEFVQLPFNFERSELAPLFVRARAAGKRLLVNRPLATGQSLYRDDVRGSRGELIMRAFSFIVERDFDGVVLVGTKNPTHLSENLALFHEAVRTSQRSADG